MGALIVHESRSKKTSSVLLSMDRVVRSTVNRGSRLREDVASIDYVDGYLKCARQMTGNDGFAKLASEARGLVSLSNVNIADAHKLIEVTYVPEARGDAREAVDGFRKSTSEFINECRRVNGRYRGVLDEVDRLGFWEVARFMEVLTRDFDEDTKEVFADTEFYASVIPTAEFTSNEVVVEDEDAVLVAQTQLELERCRADLFGLPFSWTDDHRDDDKAKRISAEFAKAAEAYNDAVSVLRSKGMDAEVDVCNMSRGKILAYGTTVAEWMLSYGINNTLLRPKVIIYV